MIQNFDVLTMLWVYLIVIAGVLSSHAMTLYFTETYEDKRDRRITKWQKRFAKNRLAGKKLSKRDIRRMKREIELSAFAAAIRLEKDGSSILTENEEEICNMAKTIRQADIRAYFAWLLQENDLSELTHEEYVRLLLFYVKNGTSVFERENTLLALYQIKEEYSVAEAWKILSERKIYHSPKLLCNDLLKAKGEREVYGAALMKVYDQLEECYQLAVINYLRYCRNTDYNVIFRSLVTENPESEDLCCAAIRLLALQNDDRNREILLNVIETYMDTDHWEMAAVAASSLQSYTDSRTLKVLENAVHSRAWYVRVNAAKALASRREASAEVLNILESNDRYAKDEMTWALNMKGVRA